MSRSRGDRGDCRGGDVPIYSLAREFTAATGQTLYFFGALHESLENGHALAADDTDRHYAQRVGPRPRSGREAAAHPVVRA